MQRVAVLLCVAALFRGSATLSRALPQACDSPIYCQGDVLRVIQMAEVFPDSKTFVDLKMNFDQSVILMNFNLLMKSSSNAPTKEQVEQFVNENFSNGTELINWVPSDYTERPEILRRIKNKDVRKFASNLISIWPNLARKVRSEVIKDNSRYSFIPVPNGFIIPGGRFKEYYYWDTYWIIVGLLVSEMHETVRGMLDNFVTIVQRYGFIPNGGRIYYSHRSQPPLLTAMAAKYYEATKDVDWIRNNVKYLEEEVLYWMNNKMVTVNVNGVNYKLARYNPRSTGPRPESYREDYRTAQKVPETERDRLYTDLQGGAESGWDFSSRWFFDDARGTIGNLTDIYTRRNIPVDLNSILYGACKHLAYFYRILNNHPKRQTWSKASDALNEAIENVFWNEEDGIWYDYDYKLKKPRRFFAVSNVAPLWTEAYDLNKRHRIASRVVNYLRENNIFNFPGGTPTTLTQTNEQWDMPNAWPPLQSILIMGLEKTKDKEAQVQAKRLAKIWIKANMVGYNHTGEMFEKYDATKSGQYGGGGEYTVQSGFGWTNGAALELIEAYYT